MAKPRLVVSAAHTSMSPGAVFKDLREFDLTRKILSLVVKHLNEEKIEHKAVPVDLQLLDRINWINDTGFSEENGDLFLEIHVNDGGERGIEGWYAGEDNGTNNAKAFAEVLIKEITSLTKFESQGIHSEYDHDLGSLLILNQTNPISVAFELLYIDNEEDYKILKDETKLDELSKNVVIAIKKYIDNPPKLHEVKKKPGGNDMFGDFDLPDFSNPFGDNFGANNSSTNSSDSLSSPSSSSSGSDNLMMDREQRKEMINKIYKKILGKEPAQNDLNYYLNIGVSEDQLIKKLTESKDFEQMVEDAKECSDIKTKFDRMEAELNELRTKVKDQESMQTNLNNLLAHKNQQIKEMMNELARRGIIKNGEYFDPNRIR